MDALTPPPQTLVFWNQTGTTQIKQFKRLQIWGLSVLSVRPVNDRRIIMVADGTHIPNQPLCFSQKAIGWTGEQTNVINQKHTHSHNPHPISQFLHHVGVSRMIQWYTKKGLYDWGPQKKQTLHMGDAPLRCGPPRMELSPKVWTHRESSRPCFVKPKFWANSMIDASRIEFPLFWNRLIYIYKYKYIYIYKKYIYKYIYI